ncbi:hypothetical protein AKO1_004734 [Acrasis kona]|uniref:Endosomal/lysosomal proton channel TMEM175 n=1 Tax=Acrasis kona TaxID=1008807 RepID=A0AAW2Z390_9EUKA
MPFGEFGEPRGHGGELETDQFQSLLEKYLLRRKSHHIQQESSHRIQSRGKKSRNVFQDLIDVIRIKLISDGVLAIILTLLVLEFSVPKRNHLSNDSTLTHALLEGWPELATYFLVVCYITLFWSAHVYVFNLVQNADIFCLGSYLLLDPGQNK